jgi:hypothetical protein
MLQQLLRWLLYWLLLYRLPPVLRLHAQQPVSSSKQQARRRTPGDGQDTQRTSAIAAACNKAALEPAHSDIRHEANLVWCMPHNMANGLRVTPPLYKKAECT